MKRKVLIFLLCIVLIITGCAENNSKSVDNKTEFEQNICAEFAAAEEAFSWFYSYGQIDMYSSDKVDCEIGYYLRVTQDGISTMKDLRNYLNRYFEIDVCNNLLSYCVEKDVPLFREFDGILYCFAAYVGQLTYNDGDKVITVDGTNQDNKITVNVHYTVTIFEKTKEVDIDYKMVKGDDNIWRFGSDFILPIEVAAKL